jgi:hypothetical protein
MRVYIKVEKKANNGERFEYIFTTYSKIKRYGNLRSS